MLLPLQVVCSKLASKARLFLLHYKLLETRYKKTQALMGATRPEAADKIAVYRVKSSFSILF